MSIRKNGQIIAGTSNLYDTTGQNTDGAMTQKAVTDELNGKVSKTGDTMSGNLTIEKTNPYLYSKTSAIDYTSTTAPSSNTYGMRINSLDKNGKYHAGLVTRFTTGNVFQTYIEAKRSISGTEKAATISVGVDANGKATYKPVQLITTYVSGTSGYNIWSNGYCEQWGRLVSSGSGVKNISISLAKTFKDTNYNILVTPQNSAVDWWSETTISYYNQKAGSFNIVYSPAQRYTNLSWKVSGYLASDQY